MEDINNIYASIREKTRQIASTYPEPDFYSVFSWANQLSLNFFETDPVIARLEAFVEQQTTDNFGHGMDHAVKVAIDAGSLIAVEGKKAGYSDEYLTRRILVAQSAGLLHDIRRVHKDHAIEGSIVAREILKAYPVFSHEETEHICQAMRNHEAFKSTVGIKTPEGMLVSDCLYDADKFRWGPDNFTHTIWDMLCFSQTSLPEFYKHYQKGIQGLSKIKTTFRTETGRKYGPDFIDIGLAIGKELHRVIKIEFREYL